MRKELAYRNMHGWLSKGTHKVPNWMAQNKNFVTSLSKVKNGEQYIKMLKQFGRHFIVNQAQCRNLLNSNNSRKEDIDKVIKVILKIKFNKRFFV